MKRSFSRFISLALCLFMCLTAAGAPAETNASDIIDTVTDASLVTSPFIDVISRVQQSVVGVSNYQNITYSNYNPYYGFGGFGGFEGFEDFFGGAFGDFFGGGADGSESETREQLAGTGSGVVVSEGFVLTNYHVVENAARVAITTLTGEEEISGVVVAYDAAADVAVIYAKELTAASVPLGDSDQLQVGEWSICIGNPLSAELAGTVTIGIISALDRQIGTTTVTDKYGLKTTVTNTMIQTNAAINSGNSGGGLFNILGQLQGVPSMKYSGSAYSGTTVEGIGLAIPINTAKPVIQEAMEKVARGDVDTETGAGAARGDGSRNGKNGGKPVLDISMKAVTAKNNSAVYMGVLPAGVLVESIEKDGCAAQAGISEYDIIVELDDIIITSVGQINTVLESHVIGDRISAKVYRAEGLATAETVDDITGGEYIDLEILLS